MLILVDNFTYEYLITRFNDWLSDLILKYGKLVR
jgi:hypothetical protein